MFIRFLFVVAENFCGFFVDSMIFEIFTISSEIPVQKALYAHAMKYELCISCSMLYNILLENVNFRPNFYFGEIQTNISVEFVLPQYKLSIEFLLSILEKKMVLIKRTELTFTGFDKKKQRLKVKNLFSELK